MKRNDNQKAERLFGAFGDIDHSMVESAREYRGGNAGKSIHVRRVLTIALAATLTLALLTVTVFAAVPSLRRMLNLPFLSEGGRQDTVPEGWIGVYTVEDLDAVRNDLDGKYILMNDLTFTDGDAPFIPIGSAEEPFMGQFDGNGYVIRGLVIEAEQETPVVSTVEKIQNGLPHSYTAQSPAEKPLYVGLFGVSGSTSIYPYMYDNKPYMGMVANLGVEGATVVVRNASNVFAGVLAGNASYLAGCYVKDCTVMVKGYTAAAQEAEFRLYAGGLAGQAQMVDSCYANATSVIAVGTSPLTEYNDENLLGALVGNAYTVITSYSVDCAVVSEHPDTLVSGLSGHVCLFPRIMNESQYLFILERYYRTLFDLSHDAPLPDGWRDGYAGDPEKNFYFKKFDSYFVPKTVDVLTNMLHIDPERFNPALFTGEFTADERMYLYDPAATMEETIQLEAKLLEIMDAATLAAIMELENFKVGPLDCYVLESGRSYGEADFAEFDFENIWEIKDGRPVLRIFEE